MEGGDAVDGPSLHGYGAVAGLSAALDLDDDAGLPGIQTSERELRAEGSLEDRRMGSPRGSAALSHEPVGLQAAAPGPPPGCAWAWGARRWRCANTLNVQLNKSKNDQAVRVE